MGLPQFRVEGRHGPVTRYPGKKLLHQPGGRESDEQAASGGPGASPDVGHLPGCKQRVARPEAELLRADFKQEFARNDVKELLLLKVEVPRRAPGPWKTFSTTSIAPAVSPALTLKVRVLMPRLRVIP